MAGVLPGSGNIPPGPIPGSYSTVSVTALHQLVTDPDQPTRRGELTAFLGPNPEGFLTHYDRIRANAATGGNRLTSLFGYGLCAPAFFLGPVWFFYRKMWLWASGYCAVMVVLSTAPIGGQAGLGLSVGASLIARWAYLDHAARTMAKLRLAHPRLAAHPIDEQAYLTALAEAGGVSKLAGWLSGLFFAAALALAVLQAFN